MWKGIHRTRTERYLETVRLFLLLSRQDLCLTICENINWVAPNGRYKIDACRQLLIKLEAQVALRLPDLRKTIPGKKTVIPGVLTDAGSTLVGTVSQFEPIHLEAVRKSKEIRLWNEYVQRYHVLGYKRPFGAHQRYFIVLKTDSEYRRLGCLLFAASAWALADRDHWIEWSETDRSQRLHLIVKNTRFLIFPTFT
ncbi:Druantia anti-phage system protein DruA [Desulfosporosinus metallidurans]|uniref:Druantia anti-phage system protein DruA n=1 Tax=Desulfosporosinus metallidurans TaxID=1888891 RepID=UPI00094C6A01|nr:Druantia anti-phage system protein DruA [Desulfosporosinus metallidurans]